MAAGAFGAHALRARLEPDLLAVFETGARYQMYHALALVGVGLAAEHWAGPLLRVAGWLFIAGTVLFSGSLYLLSAHAPRIVGAVTPLGGLCFIIGWACFAAGAWRSR